MKSAVGENIKKYRMLNNLTQKELGKLVGEESGNVVYNWEKGLGKPDCTKIIKLCNVLHVSADALIGLESGNTSQAVTQEEIELIKSYRKLDIYGKKIIDSILNIEEERILKETGKAKILELDFYNFPASAGTGNFLEDEIPEKISVPYSKEAQNADFVIKVSGDSMEPTFADQDKVFVKKQDTVSVGEIGIFILNGSAYIKELGENQLVSHNKKYSPVALTDNDSIYCCGKVLGIVE